jgi:hypothetical protein
MSTNVLEQPAPTVPVENCITVEATVFAPNPFGGKPYIPNNVTICSIYPEELRHIMLHAGRRKEYRFPAVPKGSYALLRVYDTYTLTRDLSKAAGAGNDPNDPDGTAMQQSPVHCYGVAEALIRHWAQDAPGNASGAKPGIMVIEGEKPTQFELDQLVAIQTEYFRWLVMKADEYWITGKREYITNDHRRALRWLGSEDREWYKKIDTVLLKKCPACYEDINSMATVCKHCDINLVKFYKDAGMADVPEEIDPAVFAFQREMRVRVEAANAKLREKQGAPK